MSAPVPTLVAFFAEKLGNCFRFLKENLPLPEVEREQLEEAEEQLHECPHLAFRAIVGFFVEHMSEMEHPKTSPAVQKLFSPTVMLLATAKPEVEERLMRYIECFRDIAIEASATKNEAAGVQ